MAALIYSGAKSPSAEEAREPGITARKARERQKARAAKRVGYASGSSKKPAGKLPRVVLRQMRPAQLRQQGYDPKTLEYVGKQK